MVSQTFLHLRWTAILLCAFAISINYIDRSTLSIANLDIRHDFGLSNAQFGALQSAWSMSFAFAQLPIGFMIDKYGAGLVMGLALLSWSLVVAAGGMAVNYVQLFVARAFLGVTEAPAYPAAIRITSTWFQSRDRGMPTGVVNMGANIGTALAPPLLTGFMLLLGWRSMFIAMGMIGIVGAIVWFLFYNDPSTAKLDASDRKHLGVDEQFNRPRVTGREWGRLFGFRTTWGMISGAFCVGYGLWMYVTWLPGYLEGEHHISVAKTGYLASIPLLSTIAGSFFGGYASDWLIRRGVDVVRARKLPTSLGLLACAFFTAFAAATAEVSYAVLWISCAMFSLYFSITAKWTLITAVWPQHYSASCSGIQNFGSYLGGALSPVATGLIVDKTGSFVLAFALGGAIMTGGAAFYHFLVKAPLADSDLKPALHPTPAGSQILLG